jgi:hypothetical protein
MSRMCESVPRYLLEQTALQGTKTIQHCSPTQSTCLLFWIYLDSKKASRRLPSCLYCYLGGSQTHRRGDLHIPEPRCSSRRQLSIVSVSTWNEHESINSDDPSDNLPDIENKQRLVRKAKIAVPVLFACEPTLLYSGKLLDLASWLSFALADHLRGN